MSGRQETRIDRKTTPKIKLPEHEKQSVSIFETTKSLCYGLTLPVSGYTQLAACRFEWSHLNLEFETASYAYIQIRILLHFFPQSVSSTRNNDPKQF